METHKKSAYTPISTRPTFERQSCKTCQGKGKVFKWRYFSSTCASCLGKGMAMFVVNRVGQWENVSRWLMTTDGMAYDTFAQSHVRIPTWSEIDRAVLSNIDATLDSIRSDLTQVQNSSTVVPIRATKSEYPKQ